MIQANGGLCRPEEDFVSHVVDAVFFCDAAVRQSEHHRRIPHPNTSYLKSGTEIETITISPIHSSN